MGTKETETPKKIRNPQNQLKDDFIDYYLEKSDVSGVDPLVLAGVALEIYKRLKENSDAVPYVKSGRIQSFPYPEIGLIEQPTQRVTIVLSKITPALAMEIFERRSG